VDVVVGVVVEEVEVDDDVDVTKVGLDVAVELADDVIEVKLVVLIELLVIVAAVVIEVGLVVLIELLVIVDDVVIEAEIVVLIELLVIVTAVEAKEIFN
jgi:hypothetical protein